MTTMFYRVVNEVCTVIVINPWDPIARVVIIVLYIFATFGVRRRKLRGIKRGKKKRNRKKKKVSTLVGLHVSPLEVVRIGIRAEAATALAENRQFRAFLLFQFFF